MERILMVRIGWMKYYTGSKPGDERPIGGGKYNLRKIGGEFNNFKICSGTVYGSFAIAMNAEELTLSRIDPSASGESLKKVLLIFFARDPRHDSKGQVVVGWYRNATVYSQWAKRPWWHYAETQSKNAVLLPTYRRTCVIPRGQNAPGQSNVFFALDTFGEPRQSKWLLKVLDFINTYSGPNLVLNPEAEAQPEIEEIFEKEMALALAQGVQSDSKARKMIENHAMLSAMNYFKNEGYIVTDVSSTKSYDLYCCKNKRELFVEVKGSQLPASRIILTPNEVAFARKNSSNMALYLLHSINLTRRKKNYVVQGGTRRVIMPWKIKSNLLSPLQFFYDIE
ncbi:MAG: DUF3883 domain-containing protein [Nitrospirota bacterium]